MSFPRTLTAFAVALLCSSLFGAAPAAQADDDPLVPISTTITRHKTQVEDKAQAERDARSLARQVERLKGGISYHRQKTWYYQDRMFVVRTRSNFDDKKQVGVAYLKWMARLWSDRRIKARYAYQHPPHLSQFLCIYSHEHGSGGWSTNTGNGYFGGVQMDLDFMRTYGGFLLRTKGTANNWTYLEQIWVSERAYSSGRGFHPWPRTAAMCGLI